MATTTPAATSAPDVDWEVRATEKIVGTVGKVRDQTAGRAVHIARILLLVLFAVSLGTLALLIALVGAVRALNNYLPDAVFGESHVWASYTIIGTIFLLVGLVLLFTKARRRTD